MDNKNIEKLVNECKQIQEDSTYTAEAHHIIEHKLSRNSFWCELIPVCITILSTFALLIGAPNWLSWITLLSSTIIILNVFLEPGKKAKDHLLAAKHFTSLKHEARSLHESFRDFMSENEFYNSVRRLRDRYNLLTQFAPPTDEKSFCKAINKIKSGVHEADFRRDSA